MKNNTKKIVTYGVFIALVFITTFIIKVPTPTMGYIHPGDAMVILSGLLLGPVGGAVCAGIGSGLADIVGGYFIYAPATLIIKALCALTAGLIFKGISNTINVTVSSVIGGVVAEAIMVLGYFLFEAVMLFTGEGQSLSAGFIASAAGIPMNIIQGLFGIVLSAILYPILKKVIKEVL